MPDLFNVNDGLTGRDGGPYLDQVERRHAEDQRAIMEGREPNYETMGGTVGTVYVTAKGLMGTESVNNIPSQADASDKAINEAVAALVADPSNALSVAFKAPDVPEEEAPVEDTSSPVVGSSPIGNPVPLTSDPTVEPSASFPEPVTTDTPSPVVN
jgi:hypothetical protein